MFDEAPSFVLTTIWVSKTWALFLSVCLLYSLLLYWKRACNLHAHPLSTLPWERFSRCTPQKSSEDCTYFDKVVVTNKKNKRWKSAKRASCGMDKPEISSKVKYTDIQRNEVQNAIIALGYFFEILHFKYVIWITDM